MDNEIFQDQAEKVQRLTNKLARLESRLRQHYSALKVEEESKKAMDDVEKAIDDGFAQLQAIGHVAVLSTDVVPTVKELCDRGYTGKLYATDPEVQRALAREGLAFETSYD